MDFLRGSTAGCSSVEMIQRFDRLRDLDQSLKKSKVTKADLDPHQLTSRVLDRLVTAPRNLALLR